MAVTFTFGAVRSQDKRIEVHNVRRSIMPPIVSRAITVPDRAGIYYFKPDTRERRIEVDIGVIADDMDELREIVEDLAYYFDPNPSATKEALQKLIFSDQPDRYYLACVSADTNVDQILRYGKTTVVFLVPSGFAESETLVYQNITPAAPAVFSRASAAYRQDGTQVASGQPRYEQAVFGTGILIGEGTTNILTANQSSVESGTAGFSTGTGGAAIGQEFTYAKTGKAGLVVVTEGQSTLEGVNLDFATVSPSQPYTFSVFARGNGTMRIRLEERTSGNALIKSTDSGGYELNMDDWTIMELTINTTSTTGRIIPKILTHTRQFAIVFLDAFQLENKPYRTPWHIGGGTRANETISATTSQRLFGAQGTIDFFTMKVGTAGQSAAFFDWGEFSSPINKDRIAIFHGTGFTNGERTVTLFVANGTTGQQDQVTVTLPSNMVQFRPYYIAARWQLPGTLALDVVDLETGQQYSASKSSAISAPTMTAYTSAFFGSLRNGQYWANAVYDSLRWGLSYRTNAEIEQAWRAKRPLIKDPNASLKYSFAQTLSATLVTNIGTAPSYPTIRWVFTAAATNPVLTIQPENKSLQVMGSFVAGDVVETDSARRTVTKNGASVITSVALASEFPVVTGDHYFTFSPASTADITVIYRPRWL